MNKIAIVILADTETHESMGRAVNALMAAKEFDHAGDEMTIVFDGAGVKWPVELAKADHKYHELYNVLAGRIAGVCGYCAGAFDVSGEIKAAGLSFTEDFEGHPSFKKMVDEGYTILTF